MLRISNSIKKIALSLLVACLAIGGSAYKSANLENYWFEVDPINSQTIINPTIPISAPIGDCSLDVAPQRCAVQLNTSIAPATVSLAQTAGSYVTSAYKDED